MIRIVHPAPYADLLVLIRREVRPKPLLTALAAYQAGAADSIGFVDDEGRLLAALCLWRLPDGRDECALLGEPDLARPHLTALLRLARLTLLARLHCGTMAIVAYVRCGHRPGERLARLAGFVPCDGAPPDHTGWELRHGRFGFGALWRGRPEEAAQGNAEAA